jgi:hypothetical protein
MSHERRVHAAALLLAVAVSFFVCSPARADVLLTPFVGVNFGGSASAPLADLVGDRSRTTFGGSLALMGGGIFGVEADLAYTPRFFGTELQVSGVPITLEQTSVLTAMGNFTVGIPFETHGGTGIRPYGIAGLGLIRQRINLVGGLANYNADDLGYDVGGGVLVFFGHNVGIRGDLRYFRSVGASTISDLIDLQPGAFNFTRATVGVTFRF